VKNFLKKILSRLRKNYYEDLRGRGTFWLTHTESEDVIAITGLWMCKFERLPWRTRRETVVDFLGLEPTRISTNKPQTLETGPSLDTGLSGNNTKNKEGQTVLHINRSKYSGLWLTRPVWAREHWRISPPRSWPSVKKATEPG